VVAETVVALVPVNLAVEGLKWTVNRTRPDGDRNRRNSSFPSSHAANALTVALVVGRRWRRIALPLGAFALLVCYSRMWFDRHWASDLLGAAVLALAGAWLAGRLREGWAERRSRAA
jgi:membrane-associated phospholipid phosphatase